MLPNKFCIYYFDLLCSCVISCNFFFLFIVTYKGDIPDQDVHENSQNQGPPPSAPPPLSDMDHLEGYENTQFQSGKWTFLEVALSAYLIR